MKLKIMILCVVVLMGCASMGELQERGDYTETVCTKKLFKPEECKDVAKKGMHVTKRIKLRGTGVKMDFKNDTGEGGSFIPPLPPIKVQ